MYQNRYERSRSYFYNMRRFHNNVKRYMYSKYASGINRLLDLACGKGGDLDKWVSNDIKYVMGYDINERSILEAMRRVMEYKNRGLLDNKVVELDIKDLSRNEILGKQDYDVVTSMFAFHYFFESEDTFNTIMRTIDNNLKEGGYFMGTMFDGDSLKGVMNRGVDNYELKDNNDVKFSIKLYDSLTDKIFGNKISVYLKDTVLDEPMDEYVVYFNKFVDIMNERGYELVESELFNKLYDNLNVNIKLSDVEKGVSYLNRNFVFRRMVRNICKKESDYLMECVWPIDVSEMRRKRYIEKYKKALDKKVKSATKDTKIDYMFIRDNFEKGDEIWLNENIKDSVRKYYKRIYGMFMEELKKMNLI